MRWFWFLILTIIACSVLLVLPACGGSAQAKSPYVGIVTSKIAPKGTFDCAGPLANSCSSDDQFKVIIEPLPGHEFTYGGWYEKWSTVCIAPSYWRSLHLGSRFIGSRGDLHCDG